MIFEYLCRLPYVASFLIFYNTKTNLFCEIDKKKLLKKLPNTTV